MSANSNSSSSADEVRLDERDVAAELGAIDPSAVPSVSRPDGKPGFTEQYAGAKITDAPDNAHPPIIEHPRTGPARAARATEVH